MFLFYVFCQFPGLQISPVYYEFQLFYNDILEGYRVEFYFRKLVFFREINLRHDFHLKVIFRIDRWVQKCFIAAISINVKFKYIKCT